MPEETTETATVDEVTETAAETVAAANQTPEQLKAELEGAQKRIKELNTENAKRRKQQEEFETKQAAEEEERKKKQGEFEGLFNDEKQKTATLSAEVESSKEKLAKYETILSADIETRIKDWPDEVKNLIPTGDGVDALARLESLSKLSPLVQKLTAGPTNPGNGAGPRPSGGPGSADVKAAQDAAARQTRSAF